jgi:hypothetical protein
MDIQRVKNRMDYGVMRSRSVRASGCSSCGADQLRARGWKDDEYEDEEHMEQSAVSMSGPTVKDGKLEVQQVLTPNTSVPPGGAFRISVYVTNRANVVFNDPDGCDSLAGNGCSGKDGYCIRVFADFQGQSNDILHCLNLPFTSAGSNTDVLQFEFQAPDQPGEYNVSAGFETTNSGQLAGPIGDTVTVAEGGPVTDPPDDGGGDDGSGGDLPGGGGPDGSGPGGGGLVSKADRQLIIFVVAALLALRGLSFISGD